MSRVASGEVCGLVEQAVTYGEGEGGGGGGGGGGARRSLRLHTRAPSYTSSQPLN